jgi:hypothetical protein
MRAACTQADCATATFHSGIWCLRHFVATMSRNYNDELQFLDKISKNCWRIKKGFVPNMQVRRGPPRSGRLAPSPTLPLQDLPLPCRTTSSPGTPLPPPHPRERPPNIGTHGAGVCTAFSHAGLLSAWWMCAGSGPQTFQSWVEWGGGNMESADRCLNHAFSTLIPCLQSNGSVPHNRQEAQVTGCLF